MLTHLLNSKIIACPARLISCKWAYNKGCVRFPYFSVQHYTDCAEKLIQELKARDAQYGMKSNYAKDLEVKHD